MTQAENILVNWIRANQNYSTEELQNFLKKNSISKDEFQMILKYKGIGPRFFAQVIDVGILFSIFLIVACLNYSDSLRVFKYFLSLVISSFTSPFYIAIILAYFSLFEWKFGATLGKMVAGIRVVKVSGEPLDLFTSIIRNLMRFIDAFSFYLVGAISIYCSSKRQRIGDILAKTVVVSKHSKLLSEEV